MFESKRQLLIFIAALLIGIAGAVEITYLSTRHVASQRADDPLPARMGTR